MRPIVKDLVGAGDHIIPVNTYGQVGIAYASSIPVVVKVLADKDNDNLVIETKSSSNSGSLNYPCDALKVTTTGNTKIAVVQYGA